MSKRTRVGIAVGAVAVLLIAFVIVQPGDDDDNGGTSTSVASTIATTPMESPQTSTATTPTPAATAPAPAPEPQVTRVRAVALKPVGGVRTLKVDAGDIVRFSVSSDRAESVHLHGYDMEKPVAPGSPASFTFKADIEGIFEIELEHSGELLMELQVNP